MLRSTVSTNIHSVHSTRTMSSDSTHTISSDTQYAQYTHPQYTPTNTPARLYTHRTHTILQYTQCAQYTRTQYLVTQCLVTQCHVTQCHVTKAHVEAHCEQVDRKGICLLIINLSRIYDSHKIYIKKAWVYQDFGFLNLTISQIWAWAARRRARSKKWGTSTLALY